MDIWLSVNNREEVMQIPVMPSSFAVSKTYKNETFETVSGKEILLMGPEALKTISWESFFPAEKNRERYAQSEYIRNRDMWGWDYIYTIDTWRQRKLPIRLIITYEHEDTPINIAVAVENLDYEMRTDGDLLYSVSFKQVDLLGHETIIPWYDEEEINMEELEELKAEVASLRIQVETLANPFIYNYMDDNMEEWAKASVQKAMDKGVVQGTGSGLGLKYDDLRHIVMLDRAGVLD